MQPVLKVVSAAFLLAPHLQPMRVERHHLRLSCALLMKVIVEKIAEMLRDLVAKLDAHTDVGNAAEERLQHCFGLVAIAVRSKVGEDAAQLIARHESAVRSDHDVVPIGQIPQRKQFANCRRLHLFLVFRVCHRHGLTLLADLCKSCSNPCFAIRVSGTIPS